MPRELMPYVSTSSNTTTERSQQVRLMGKLSPTGAEGKTFVWAWRSGEHLAKNELAEPKMKDFSRDAAALFDEEGPTMA